MVLTLHFTSFAICVWLRPRAARTNLVALPYFNAMSEKEKIGD
jgi:hypothetical protein